MFRRSALAFLVFVVLAGCFSSLTGSFSPHAGELRDEVSHVPFPRGGEQLHLTATSQAATNGSGVFAFAQVAYAYPPSANQSATWDSFTLGLTAAGWSVHQEATYAGSDGFVHSSLSMARGQIRGPTGCVMQGGDLWRRASDFVIACEFQEYFP